MPSAFSSTHVYFQVPTCVAEFRQIQQAALAAVTLDSLVPLPRDSEKPKKRDAARTFLSVLGSLENPQC